VSDRRDNNLTAPTQEKKNEVVKPKKIEEKVEKKGNENPDYPTLHYTL